MSMKVGGVSIILILGIVNFFLLMFQFLSGRRFIKVSPGIHRKVGTLFLVTALAHGVLGILANM
jgi:hypothetical protein